MVLCKPHSASGSHNCEYRVTFLEDVAREKKQLYPGYGCYCSVNPSKGRGRRRYVMQMSLSSHPPTLHYHFHSSQVMELELHFIPRLPILARQVPALRMAIRSANRSTAAGMCSACSFFCSIILVFDHY